MDMSYRNMGKFWNDQTAKEFVEGYMKEQIRRDIIKYLVYEPTLPDLRFLETFILKQGIGSRELEQKIFLNEKIKGGNVMATEAEQFEESVPTRKYEFPDFLFKHLRIKSDAELFVEYEEETKVKLQGEEETSELYEILDDEGIHFSNKCKPWYLYHSYPGQGEKAFTEEDFYNNEKRIDKNEEIDYHVRNLSYTYAKTQVLKDPRYIFNADRIIYGIDKHFYFYRQRPWASLREFFEGSPDAWEYVFIYYFSYAFCLYILRKLFAFCKWFWGFGGEVPFRFFWWPF